MTAVVDSSSQRTLEQRTIMRRLNTLIRRGEPFTVDRIWRDGDPFKPGEHKSWVGRQIQLFAQAERIEPVGWAETPRSMPHSRPARLWRGRG